VLTDQQTKDLDKQGYVVLERLLPEAVLNEVRSRVEELYALEGENAGSEFRKEAGARRLANLVDKGAIFEKLVAVPEVLELVRHVLGEKFKLSSFNARSTDPYCQDAQPLHCDAGALPDQRGYTVCNTIWLLDDFTPDNGATRVLPGSHKWKELPQNVLADPAAKHPEEVLVLGPAGSVVVMNTHAWHGGTANLTAGHRRALHVFYCREDLPQQQYQKKLLRPETQAHLTPELRGILALDDAQNDLLSSAASGASGFLK
jgi:ectoine hydroxylase-related dioxygenase (phytanoyl-CoA dioxygenase family)